MTVQANPAELATRVLAEGYGPGAWHGSDMKPALADVPDATAFWRPGPGRHNIAELAVHHAFYQHSVRGRLIDAAIEPFPLAGEDFFTLDDGKTMSWPAIVALVGDMQTRLVDVATDVASGKRPSSKTEAEQLDLLLGITCHAVYHAGQIQLIKALKG
jgi:hypothetical protein